ncbi:MAG: RNA-binding protein [Tannerella sp.]|jgi:RNA recognition motif-containing protein|nr:RNA-binding protein [Tannerella sp.]
MNIYIGNLNYRVREENLKRVLEEYGAVDSVRIIKDRDTGRSKGFAFAEMPDDNEARNAISSLNESEWEGRRLIMKEAMPRN